ncbi:MAG: thiosulfate oxidation carrier complex protein SoxZ [Candidatus Omnitrophica bacterium]|nr:thiosulfate oxidation carrier complex protein SoxZ [Candidatus Omnitrophota bacterium]
MKRNFIIFLIMGLMMGSNGFCHPPSDIVGSFDSQTKLLKAQIKHASSNPGRHYIERVEIFLNGKQIISHKISKQADASEQSVTYQITDIKKGDKLTVEAYCNISGVMKKTIEVEK